MSADEGLVRIGRVIKPHGIRGELVVAAEGQTLAELPLGSSIVMAGKTYSIAGRRPHQGRLLVTIDECVDRTTAETFRDAWVEVVNAGLPGLDDEEWYAADLVGWTLCGATGADIGVVADVLPGPVHDYLQIGTGAPQLVPMVRDWLVEVDAGRRAIVMKLPAGLLDQDGE